MNRMIPLINAVKDMKDACAKAAEANIQFAQVFTPKMSDLSLIGKIHQLYVKVADESGFSGDGTSNNKQFVFLVLYLYSPASLCGGTINRKLRKAVASVLGINADTALYKMRATSVSWYDTYPEFRNECNRAIEEISRQMTDL